MPRTKRSIWPDRDAAFVSEWRYGSW